MVLLKMIKKFYFPDTISTYYLKNLLFWECESKEEAFWKEDNSANCLLFMLDRLKECLKAHHLAHYIMPQSNLLQYQDPVSLDEAAVIVEDVRRTILPKTVVLLKRLQSMSYLSSTYLQDIGLHLESHLSSMQDENLPKKDQMVLLSSLYSVFVNKGAKDARAPRRHRKDVKCCDECLPIDACKKSVQIVVPKRRPKKERRRIQDICEGRSQGSFSRRRLSRPGPCFL